MQRVWLARTGVFLAGVAALLSLTPPALGQEYGRIEDTEASVPGFYYYARPGEAVVAVTIIGVAADGRYLLGQGATVADLLALSRGFGVTSPGQDPLVRVYRSGQSVYESELRGVYGPGATPPVLEDEDVVEVVALVSTAPGYHVHSVPGAETLVVTAAGAFGAPGRYVVDVGTTVGDLVALAGGFADRSRSEDIEITTTVRVYRDAQVAFESELEQLYARETPPLEAGDVVDLEVLTDRRFRFTFQNTLGLVSAVFSFILLTERVVSR